MATKKTEEKAAKTTVAVAKKTAPAKATTAAKPAKATAPAKATTAAKKAAPAKAASAAKATATKTATKAVPAKKEESKKAEPQVKKTATKTAAKATTAKAAAAKTTAVKKAEPTKKAAAAKTSAAKVAEPKSAEKKAGATTAKKASAAKAATTATAKKATAAKEPASKTTASKATATAKATEAKATAAKKAEPKKTEPEAKKTAAAAQEPAAKKVPTASKAATTAKTVAKKAEPKAAAAKKAEPKAAEPKKVAAAKKPAEKKDAKKAEPKKAAAVKPVAKKEEPAKPEPKAEESKAAAAKAAEAVPETAQPAPAKVEAEQVAAEVAEFAGVGGVLIAAAECAPLVKVGGLADIVGALPKYLAKLGVDARVVMPLHRQIKERYYNELQHMASFEANLGWRSQYVGLEKMELDGVTFYFIDNEFYFGGPIYCGGEFEGEQYAFFTRAVLDAIPLFDFDIQVLHCNDWHTAMMPLLVKTQYQGGVQSGLKTVLTIHNLHFQGKFSHEWDRDLLRVDDSLATPQFIAHYECDNMLKAGIVFADKVNTVSPTYAREICEPFLGESLDGVLRSRGGDLWGILNGIDTEVWNPATDELLPQQYTASSLEGKKQVRDALLEELGLAPAGEDTAVIAMVGRLTPQKGLDLVRCVLDDILAEDVRFIVLGSGDAEYEGFLRDAENRHKGQLCSFIGYNGELSHRIYAGADLFLMPSLFEPCGISQMISMRYGTLPIVRETGGLKDTVVPYNEFTGEGNGFSFANYNAHEMLGVIRWALSVWRDKAVRERLVKQAMESDFSFDRCARAYAELYRSL